MENILFFAPYSEENLVFSEAIDGDGTKIFLWRTPLLEGKGDDYFSFDDNFSDDFYEKVMIINHIPQEIVFFSEIINVIKEFGFSPDAMIVKGSTTDILPFAMIKDEYGIDFPIITILDNVDRILQDFENFALDQFDEIITFVPEDNFPEIDKSKVRFLFKDFDASKFKSLAELGLYNEVKESKLIVCNDDSVYENIEEKYGKDSNISIINANRCDVNEIVIYSNLSETIVDATDSKEFSMVIKKIGKNSIQLKEFERENFNSIDEGKVVLPCSVNNLKDFCFEIKKDIQEIRHWQ